jgi:ribonuclease HI
VVHGGDFLHPNALISAAVSYIEDYHQAMKLEEEEGVVEGEREWWAVGLAQPIVVIWKPLPFGFYKVNWDASLNHAQGKVGIAVMVPDSNGKIVAASSSSLHASVVSVVAESIAAVHAVEFCHGRGFQKIVLEGDSLQVVSAIKNRSLLWATHEQVIADIQDLLRFFQSWEVCHSKLAGNAAAHLLAQAGLHHAQERVWIICIAECLRHFVSSEVFLWLFRVVLL